MMISHETINQAVSNIVAVAEPCQVILFGSYARNEATHDSDLDLLVIKPQLINKGMEMVKLRHAVGHIGIGVDVLVYSQQEVDKRGKIPSSALYYALKEGKVLYMTQPTEEELRQEALRQEAQRFFRLASRDANAFRVLKDAPDIHLSTVCFHAQQAVEKSLKAVIIRQGIELRRTHDLETLTSLLLEQNIMPPSNLEELSKLNPYAVTFRYDDTDIELLSRNDAENIMNTIQHWAEEQIK